MTTEEKIKAAILGKIAEEAGVPPGFATARTPMGGQFTLAPPPIVVVVFEDGTVSLPVFSDGVSPNKGRPNGPALIQEPDLGRTDLSEDEKSRLTTQFDAALDRAHALKRADFAIIVFAKPARVEVRTGPTYVAPAVRG
jgi:hypothetical protein